VNNRDQKLAPDKDLWIAKVDLQSLIKILQSDGYTVVGPTIEQEAIVYAEIDSIDQLPIGWRDCQEPGKYRLLPSEDDSYFEFNVGPHSWKQFLFPPQVTVETAEHTADGWQFERPTRDPNKYALLGVRACELAAIRVQDRVFLSGPYVDPDYQSRRESALIIAVNCTVAAKTCFCTSMDTGPRCDAGFDLALTEIDDGFVIEIGSERGAEMAQRLDHHLATPKSAQAAEAARQRAEDQIEKRMDTSDIRELLLSNLDHPRWDDVAQRCLSCTNCTMVCPTCFCSSVSEVSDLSGDHVQRVRHWDSCFNADFSYTAGGTIRGDIRSRYRQWLTHKLASWHDQFDSSGCVGCGRCITWCPVGIDLTEEVAAIRDQPSTQRSLPVLGQTPSACTVPKSNA
jgi:sulfhydrogenase subunit beta (sulfur reductase)